MRITKVYELQDATGTVIDVGYTHRPKVRMYEHTRRKPTLKGCGRHYGRTDLKMVIVSEHSTRKEAGQHETALKLEHGLQPTERMNGPRMAKLCRKLTMEQAQEIRTKYIPYKYTLIMLATDYNTSLGIIYGIVNNLTYNKSR